MSQSLVVGGEGKLILHWNWVFKMWILRTCSYSPGRVDSGEGGAGPQGGDHLAGRLAAHGVSPSERPLLTGREAAESARAGARMPATLSHWDHVTVPGDTMQCLLAMSQSVISLMAASALQTLFPGARWESVGAGGVFSAGAAPPGPTYHSLCLGLFPPALFSLLAPLLLTGVCWETGCLMFLIMCSCLALSPCHPPFPCCL